MIRKCKISLKVVDKIEAQNEAWKLFEAHAQASGLSTPSRRLVLRLGYNISKHFAQARA